MKKQLILLALAGLGAACQPQAAQTTAATTAPNPAPAPLVVPAQATQVLPTLFTPADTLAPPQRALLRMHDLSQLWQNAERAEGPSPNPSFDGFFGPDRYRFGMVFNEVSRDPADPARYLVRGKCNYHKSKNIRPFSGTLTVRQLVELKYPGFVRSVLYPDTAGTLQGHLYTARAQLRLRETPQANSGIFEGEVVLDFYVVPGQPANYVYVIGHEGYEDQLPTRGGKLLVRGNRLNVTTGQVKSFLVGPELGAIAPHIFKDFMLDERMGQINPKYAKLGWNDYWQNDEWWADSPNPSLSL
ncbi:MAG: hypothetical protein EOO62_25265 [Hymenobacter sp.]|nr:MAG: hypothetical protein EOO62_25265 [Hymenobacter sp.]